MRDCSTTTRGTVFCRSPVQGHDPFDESTWNSKGNAKPATAPRSRPQRALHLSWAPEFRAAGQQTADLRLVFERSEIASRSPLPCLYCITMDGMLLPPDLEQFVAEEVAAGRYRDFDEVVRAGIDLPKQRAKARTRYLHLFWRLRRKVTAWAT